jgi:hypothetical protein
MQVKGANLSTRLVLEELLLVVSMVSSETCFVSFRFVKSKKTPT